MYIVYENTLPSSIIVFVCMNLKLPRPHGCALNMQNPHIIFPSKNMPFWQHSQREGFSAAIKLHIFCKTLFKFMILLIHHSK